MYGYNADSADMILMNKVCNTVKTHYLQSKTQCTTPWIYNMDAVCIPYNIYTWLNGVNSCDYTSNRTNLWNPKWQPRNDCDGKLSTKLQSSWIAYGTTPSEA